MKIYIARHGRTNYNDLGLCNADPTVDVHLTLAGIRQAEILADKLKQAHINHIFVSELRRTQQTAEIVNAFHGVGIEVESRLNDCRSGYEGKPFQHFKDALDTSADRWTTRLNDGESIEDIKKRVAAFVDDLRATKYDSVLIVTSEWIIRAMIAIVSNLANEQAWSLDIGQGSYLELEL